MQGIRGGKKCKGKESMWRGTQENPRKGREGKRVQKKADKNIFAGRRSTHLLPETLRRRQKEM